MDVEKAIENADERELHALWNRFFRRRLYQDTLAIAADPQHPKHADLPDPETTQRVMEEALAELPAISAVDALRVNAQLVKLLDGSRWIVMRDAREAGASWAEIGEALGMSKQGAWDWYKRKIELQERYAGDFHDAERARAS